MMQFAKEFPDIQKVTPLVAQLSWTHFIVLMSVENQDARMFYAQKSIDEKWSKRTLANQIERKAFERKEIAQAQLTNTTPEIQHSFKDPYFLDFLGLKEGYLENDLEGAILNELQQFIFEDTSINSSFGFQLGLSSTYFVTKILI